MSFKLSFLNSLVRDTSEISVIAFFNSCAFLVSPSNSAPNSDIPLRILSKTLSKLNIDDSTPHANCITDIQNKNLDNPIVIRSKTLIAEDPNACILPIIPAIPLEVLL